MTVLLLVLLCVFVRRRRDGQSAPNRSLLANEGAVDGRKARVKFSTLGKKSLEETA